MSIIIYKNYAGLTVRVTPTREASIEYLISNVLPPNVDYLIVHDNTVLPDTKYRDAWVLVDGTIVIDQTLAKQIDDAAFKTTRSKSVNAIKVVVNNKEFDGDEDSQSRMVRAIAAAKTLQSPVIPFWKLADNSTAVNIPVADLEMALALSVVAMAQVWV